MMTANPVATAIAQAMIADAAWKAAYLEICPKKVWPGDFRYSAAARGAPGSELRALHDFYLGASAEMHAAWKARDAA